MNIEKNAVDDRLIRIEKDYPFIEILPSADGVRSHVIGMSIPKDNVEKVNISTTTPSGEEWEHYTREYDKDGNPNRLQLDNDRTKSPSSTLRTWLSPQNGLESSDVHINIRFPSYTIDYRIGVDEKLSSDSFNVTSDIFASLRGEEKAENASRLISTIGDKFGNGELLISNDAYTIRGTCSENSDNEWTFNVTRGTTNVPTEIIGSLARISVGSTSVSDLAEKFANDKNTQNSQSVTIHYFPENGIVSNDMVSAIDECFERDDRDDVVKDGNKIDNVERSDDEETTREFAPIPPADELVSDALFGAVDTSATTDDDETGVTNDDMTGVTNDDDTADDGSVSPDDAATSDALFGATVDANGGNEKDAAQQGDSTTKDDGSANDEQEIDEPRQDDGNAPVDKNGQTEQTEPEKGLPAFATRDIFNPISQSLDMGSIPVFMLGGNRLSCEGLEITKQDMEAVRDQSPDFGMRLGFDSFNVQDSQIEKVSYDAISDYIFSDDDDKKSFLDKYDTENIYVVTEKESPINPSMTVTYNGKDMEYRPSNRITVLAYKKIDADISNLGIRAMPDAACFLADSAGGFVERIPLFKGGSPNDDRIYGELPLDWSSMRTAAEEGVGIQFAAEEGYRGTNSDAVWQNMGDIEFGDDPYAKSTEGFMSLMNSSFGNNKEMFRAITEEKSALEEKAQQSVTASDAGIMRLAQPIYNLQKAITDYINTDSKDVEAHRNSLSGVMKAAMAVYPDAKLASIDERPEHLNTRTEIANTDNRAYNAAANDYDNFDAAMKYIYEKRSDGSLTGKADTEWIKQDVWKDKDGNVRYFDVFRECVLRAEGITGELPQSSDMDKYVESDVDKDGDTPFTQADIDEHDDSIIRERIYVYNHGDIHLSPRINQDTGNIERSDDGRGNIRYRGGFYSKDTLRQKEEQMHMSKDGFVYTNDGHKVLPFRMGKFPTTVEERNRVMYERYNPSEDRTLSKRDSREHKCDIDTYAKRMEQPLFDGSEVTRGQYAVNAYKNVFEQTIVRDVDGKEADVVDKDYLARMGVGVMDTDGVIANMLALAPDGKIIAEAVRDIVADGRFYIKRDDVEAARSAMLDDQIYVDNPTTDSIIDAVSNGGTGPYDGGGWTTAAGTQYDENGNPLDSFGRALTYGQLNRDAQTDVKVSRVKTLELRQQALAEAQEIGKRENLSADEIKQKSDEIYGAKYKAVVTELRQYVSDARKYEAVMTSYHIPRVLEGKHMTVQYAKYQHTAALFKYEKAGGECGRNYAVTKSASSLDLYMAKRGFIGANYLSTIVYNLVDKHECEVKADRAIRASHDTIVKNAEETVKERGLTGESAKAEIKNIVAKAEKTIRKSYVDDDKYRIFGFVPKWDDGKGKKEEIRQYRSVTPLAIAQIASYIVPPLINPVFGFGFLVAAVSSVVMAAGLIIKSDIESARTEREIEKRVNELTAGDSATDEEKSRKINSIVADIGSKTVDIPQQSSKENATASDDNDKHTNDEKESETTADGKDNPTDDRKEDSVDSPTEKTEKNDTVDKEQSSENVDNNDSEKKMDSSEGDKDATVSNEEKENVDNGTDREENEKDDDAVSSDDMDEPVDEEEPEDEISLDEDDEANDGTTVDEDDEHMTSPDTDEDIVDAPDKDDEKAENMADDDEKDDVDKHDVTDEESRKEITGDENAERDDSDATDTADEDDSDDISDDDKNDEEIDEIDSDDDSFVSYENDDADNEKEKERIEGDVDAVAASMQPMPVTKDGEDEKSGTVATGEKTSATAATKDESKTSATAATKDEPNKNPEIVRDDRDEPAKSAVNAEPYDAMNDVTAKEEANTPPSNNGTVKAETSDSGHVVHDTVPTAVNTATTDGDKQPDVKISVPEGDVAEAESNKDNGADVLIDTIVNVAYGLAETSDFIDVITAPDANYDEHALGSALLSAVDTILLNGGTPDDLVGIGIPEMAGEIASLSNDPQSSLASLADSIADKYDLNEEFTDDFIMEGIKSFSSPIDTQLSPEFMGTAFDDGQMFDAGTGEPVDALESANNFDIANDALTQDAYDSLDTQFAGIDRNTNAVCAELESAGIDTTGCIDGIASFAADMNDTVSDDPTIDDMTQDEFAENILREMALEEAMRVNEITNDNANAAVDNGFTPDDTDVHDAVSYFDDDEDDYDPYVGNNDDNADVDGDGDDD